MSKPARPSFLPLVRRQLGQLAAITAAVFLPVGLLLIYQDRRDVSFAESQTRQVRRLSVAQDAMLALDELRAVPTAPANDAEARGRVMLARVSYRIGQLLNIGAAGFPDDAQPIVERVRRLEAELSASGGSTAGSVRMVALSQALRDSLDQIRLLQQEALAVEHQAFREMKRRIFGVAIPSVALLLLIGGVVAAFLIRSVRRQWKLEDEIRENLVRSEERYRSLFDGSLDAIFSLGADGRFVSANPAAARLTGRTIEELKTVHFLELCAPDHREEAATAFRAAFCRECLTLDTAMIGADGARREIFISGAPTVLGGQVVGVACIARDMTGKREAEEKLRERDALLQKLSEQVPGVIYQFQLFADGRSCFPYASEGLRAIYEVTPEAVRESSDAAFRVIYPADLAAVAASIQRSAQTLEPWSYQYRVQLPIRGLRWLEGHSAPERLPDGSTLWHGYIRDITERKAAEAEFQRLASIIEISHDFIGYAALDGRHLYLNQAGRAMVGIEASAPIGDLYLPDFVPESDHDFLQRELMTHLNRDGAWRGEFRLRHFGGLEPIPVDLNLFMIRDPSGEPIAIASISRDIRERLKAERQANRSQRLEAIGTLAGGIAHDLNNALAPVLMSTQVLQLRYPGEDEVVVLIQESCQRAADMVRQLLTFAKGAPGPRVLLQPRQLIGELEKFVSGTFPKNIQLKSHCASDLGMLLGDPTQLHQVLLNLCVNARDAMPDGGVLTMRADSKDVDALYASGNPDAKPGRYVCLTVEDTGGGIAPGILDRICEPFFTTKGPDKGTGMGLSTVAGIVRGHTGFMRIYSEAGHGSLFQIYLPLSLDESGPPETVEKVRPAYIGGGQTILIVDDEAPILRVASKLLTRMNFNVVTAADGTDALARASELGDSLHVVITDLHMPRMDGLAFAKILRPMCPNVKIVVSSGRFEEGASAEFSALGISALLHKPFTEVQLADMLRTILEAGHAP